MLSHHCRHGSRSRHLGLLRHTLAEVSGGEGGVALWYHPCRKVGHEIQTFQRYNARRHQIACREERVLQIGCHHLLTGGDGRQVLYLYAEHYVKEQQHVETDEVWGMMRFRKSKQILDI